MAENTNGQAKADEAPTFGAGSVASVRVKSVPPPSSKAPLPARRTLSFANPHDARLIRPPPPPLGGALEQSFPKAHRRLEDIAQWLDGSELEDEASPVHRASERATVPSLSLPQAALLVDESTLELKALHPEELSASELKSEPDMVPIPKPRSEPLLADLMRAIRKPVPSGLHISQRARANTDARQANLETSWESRGASTPPATRNAFLKRVGVPLVLSHLAVAAAVAFLVFKSTPTAHIAREKRAATADRTSLAAGAATPAPIVPAGACAATGTSRVLAAKAQVGTGLELGVLDTGFAVGLASGPSEAVGLRLEGSRLRLAETVRVKSSALVHHVAVEPRDEEGDLGVRIDADDARTIIGAGDAPPFRIVARGAHILGLIDDPHGVQPRPLWSLPRGAPSKSAHGGEIVRAFGRDDGGAVIALRRPSTLWLGVTDPALAPEGPLVPLARKGATLGTPSLTQWGGGGAVAWAERPAGEREWQVMVAAFTPDGEGATLLGPIQNVARGMSPTIATLPDGDLLVAYAIGGSGAHRVVARRLSRELMPRGEELMVSPDSVNAGQPVAAVRPDGRAMIAYFSADRGRAASVLGTALDCDPGL